MALPPAVIGLIAAAALGTVVVLLLVNVTYILAALIAAIIIFFSISIAVLISQPFSGALIRLRANYLPKAVSLDNVLEDGQAAGADGGRGGATTRKISAYLLTQRRQSAKIVSDSVPRRCRSDTVLRSAILTLVLDVCFSGS